MKKTESINASQAVWGDKLLKKFAKIAGYEINSNSSKFSAYAELNQLFLVEAVHEKVNVSLNDDLVKFVNPNLNLQILYRFNKAFNCVEAVNLTEKASSGKLPFSSYTDFGHLAVDAKKVDKKKTYICKLDKNQVAELDKLIKSDRIEGTIFNEKLRSYFPSKSKAKTPYEKAKAAAKYLVEFTQKKIGDSRRLTLQSSIDLISAQLIAMVEPQAPAVEAPAVEVKKRRSRVKNAA